MWTRGRIVPVAFYGALVAAIAGVLLEVLPVVLPEGVATRIGHNSEGLVLALLLAMWIQYARPRLTREPRQWWLTALVAAGCLAIGVALLLSDLPSRFRTLNETFLAAALLLPYLQARRPLPRGLAAGLALGVLALVVVFNRTGAVTALAESLGVLLLVPLAFDLVDRHILDPSARDGWRLRVAWYAVLVGAPVLLSVLQYQVGLAGLPGEAVRYGVRITEAFVCLLLVELYLTAGLRCSGRPAAPGAEPALATSATR